MLCNRQANTKIVILLISKNVKCLLWPCKVLRFSFRSFSRPGFFDIDLSSISADSECNKFMGEAHQTEDGIFSLCFTKHHTFCFYCSRKFAKCRFRPGRWNIFTTLSIEVVFACILLFFVSEIFVKYFFILTARIVAAAGFSGLFSCAFEQDQICEEAFRVVLLPFFGQSHSISIYKFRLLTNVGYILNPFW